MQWLIAYDISDDKKRSKACRLLRRFSGGYQLSGFEVLNETSNLKELLQQLAELIEPQDKLLLVKNGKIGPDWSLGTGPKSSKSSLLVFA